MPLSPDIVSKGVMFSDCLSVCSLFHLVSTRYLVNSLSNFDENYRE